MSAALVAEKVAGDTTPSAVWPGSDEAKAETLLNLAEKQMRQKPAVRQAGTEVGADEREAEAHMRDITGCIERIRMARQRATLRVEKVAIDLQRITRGCMIRKKMNAAARRSNMIRQSSCPSGQIVAELGCHVQGTQACNDGTTEATSVEFGGAEATPGTAADTTELVAGGQCGSAAEEPPARGAA